MFQESMKHTKCSFMPKVKHNEKRMIIVTFPLPFVTLNQFHLGHDTFNEVLDENLCILPTILLSLVGKTPLGNKCKK